MRSTTRLRVTELFIAVAAVGTALVWAERTAWREISTLRTEMQAQLIGRFRDADEFRARILQLHELWRRNLAETNAAARAAIHTEGRRVKDLIAAQLRMAASPAERELITEIGSGLEVYLGRVQESFAMKPSPAESHVFHASREGVELSWERLLALLEQLTAANRSATEQFITQANGMLTSLQRFLFASLLGLLLCGAAIIMLIYRRTIAPLRSTLTESRALIERQEKLASLGVFATGIAHEIRNPLTAIKVRLFTLKSSHQPGTSESEDLEVIRAEIDRLEHIVRDFLQFARPAEPDLQTISVAQLLRDVGSLLQSDLAGKSVELKLDLQTSQSVRVDPNKMKQVLINFVQNGADSMETGGTVVLRSRLDQQVLNARPVPVVVIDIVDSGKGMPLEVQKRLFDPFFTTKENGTGLGLPIAARIVEKHGGVIQYKTHPKRGTTFSIVLPTAPENEPQS